MTREEVKELLPIMQAYAEGKTVQYLSAGGHRWLDCNDPLFSKDDKYRIKPEPKYRPFKSREECWNEMHKHPDFGWVKSKEDQYINILSVDDNKSFSNWFKFYTFTDGKPFGIEENL